MSYTSYLVPTELLSTAPPGSGWHATTAPSDPTLSLVIVDWDNPNLQTVFESQPGVVYLGLPWEPVPDPSLLAPFSGQVSAQVTAPSTVETLTPPDSVSVVLRQVDWPGARLVR